MGALFWLLAGVLLGVFLAALALCLFLISKMKGWFP